MPALGIAAAFSVAEDRTRAVHPKYVWFHSSSSDYYVERHRKTSCDAPAAMPPKFEESTTSDGKSTLTPDHSSSSNHGEKQATFGFQANAEGDFHGLFPLRQLFHPSVSYPLWDPNWDGRQPKSTGDLEADKERMRIIRRKGTTRHIILIRHGQYDETSKVS